MNTQPESIGSGSVPFLTDGGLETTVIFHHGIELPEFAAFHLMREESGRSLLRDYYSQYLEIAAELGTGFILESPTWRANPQWGEKIGYSGSALRAANLESVAELEALRAEFASRVPELLISGCVGPRGDGYSPANQMSAREAESYHSTQIEILADAGVDFISAMTINYVEEAIGIVRAARAAGTAPVISFTVETDGRLPTGEALGDAIARTDAESAGGAAYFMINCAHPTHFDGTLQPGTDWSQRIRGIRANASRLSHEELDESETLDDGDPADLADRLRRLKATLPELAVFGGCCGTDHRHIRAIGDACVRSQTENQRKAAMAS